ncbi:MAG: bifunctional diaminohydroxyphosphoribosylaminopyrimidine deaminase/5-amino-6-(5-phosphoribosylamino)uracil reductase RibD [Fibrobacterota bacterium]
MLRLRFTPSDTHFMERALELAVSVKGLTGDNPAVGAVIVKNGKNQGEGRTQPPGEEHAEKQALKKAGNRSRGATLYVTLEPCCHTGRTGPCTKAIIDAGVTRVVAAVRDPNPKVAGKGLAALRRAGIRIELGLLENEAAALNEDFFKYITTGLPFVTLKAALTLSGHIAADSGDSKWITGPEARKRVHALRAQHDAVLVGMGTVRHDNPELTVRLVRGRNPMRVVLSGGAPIPQGSRLAQTAQQANTLLLRPLRKNGRMRMRSVLKALGDQGIKSVLVEGGNAVFTGLLKERCVDRVALFLAPKILLSGIPFLKGCRTEKVSEALRLSGTAVERVGEDFLITGRPAY